MVNVGYYNTSLPPYNVEYVMGISVHLAVRRQSGNIASLNKRHFQHLLDALIHTFNYIIVNNVRMI